MPRSRACSGERLQQPDIARGRRAAARHRAPRAGPRAAPLFAGHLAQAWPTEPHLALWFGITLLREYRGDGHIAALTADGVSGIEALVLHGATGAVPPAVLQAHARLERRRRGPRRERGLQARGWLARRRFAHARWVGRTATRSSGAPTNWLRRRGRCSSDDDAIWLAALGKELSGAIVAAGTFPGR